MIGISGTALGAILRSKKYSYSQISLVAMVYAIVMLIISVIALLLGATASAFMTWIPDTIVLIFAAFLIGVGSFVALIFGAVIFDISEAIIKGAK